MRGRIEEQWWYGHLQWDPEAVGVRGREELQKKKKQEQRAERVNALKLMRKTRRAN
jgi:hypothetical protein